MLGFLKNTARAGLGAGLGLALLATASPASADRGGDIAAGIIGGAVVGSILGSGQRAHPVYVEPAPRYYRGGCAELRERAREAEYHGYPERAHHLWHEYRDCRGD